MEHRGAGLHRALRRARRAVGARVLRQVPAVARARPPEPQVYPARGARAAVDSPGHPLSVGGPPRSIFNTFVARVSDEFQRGHRVVVVAPSSVAHAGARLAQGRPQRRARPRGRGGGAGVGGGRGPAAAARAPPRGAADQRRADDLRPVRERPTRPLPRPPDRRAERWPARGAAPLARAQRRHLPRADRARRRHAGRAQGRAARLGQLDAPNQVPMGPPPTCCAASSRASTRSWRPAPTRSPSQRADDAPVRHRLHRAGGARRMQLFLRWLRRLDPGLRWEAVVHCRRAGRRRRRRCAPTCSSACASSTTPTRRSRAPTCSSRPPTASPRRPGSSRARRRRAPFHSPRAWPSTRRCWATARPGCSSSPTTSRRSPRSSAEHRGRRPARAPARGGPAAAVELVADQLEALYAGRARGASPQRPRQRRDRPQAAEQAHDRRRPAHAHRPQPPVARPVEVLLFHRARPGSRRDRGDRPQRGLRGPRGRGQGGRLRGEGPRGRGGQDGSSGEVIGLFLNEKIPARADPRGNGRRDPPPGRHGLRAPPVRPHARRPRLRRLLGVVEDVSAIEVYNPRVAIGSFNEEAARFAAKYRILYGAAGPASPRGSARCACACPTSTGRTVPRGAARGGDHHQAVEPALRAGAEALRTKAAPPGARERRRERRVRRAIRKP